MRSGGSRACCVLVIALQLAFLVQSEIAHIELEWSGGSDNCDCPAGGDDYACTYGSDSGEWLDGIKYFKDTQPASSILTQMAVSIYGSFDCNSSHTLTLVFNRQVVIAELLMPQNYDPMCSVCANCFAAQTPVTFLSQIYPFGWPGYTTGITNTVGVIVNASLNARFCLSDVAFSMVYNTTGNNVVDSSSSGDNIQLDAPLWFFSLLTAGGVVVAVLVVVFFLLWRRSSRRNTKYNQMGYRKLGGNEYRDPRQLDEINIDMSKITIEGEIGRGSFGLVCRGIWRSTEVAIKRLPQGSMNDEQTLVEFMKEAFIMQKLRHPNVLQVLGVCLDPACIVMEYMPRGSLYQLAHNPHTTIDWPMLKKIAVDVCKGMAYLHGCNPPLIHRDLKPHNLLVDENWRVKVCDFGLSRFLEAKKNMTACGTPAYAAPEVLRNSSYSTSADVYSFGVVLWELITRETPYPDMPPFQIIFAVGTQKLRPVIPATCPAALTRLIEDCWDEDAASRPSFLTLAERINSMTENMTLSFSKFSRAMS